MQASSRLFLLSVIMLVFCHRGLAQSKAVIVGPSTAFVGDMVILDATPSSGSVYSWTQIEGKTCYAADQGKRLLFAIGSPGAYNFVLAVGGVDSTGVVDVSQALHRIQIIDGNNPNPPTPIPPNPNPPVPPTPTPLTGTAKFAHDAGMKLQATTRLSAPKMSSAFSSVASRAAGLSTMTPKDMIEQTDREISINMTTAERRGWKPWVTSYVAHMHGLKLNPLDRAGHIEAWNNLAKGLGEVK